MALISLHQCLVTLLFSAEELSPRDLLATKAVKHLVDDALDMFKAAERGVEDAGNAAEGGSMWHDQG